MFARGVSDGELDTARIAACPPQPAAGPQPPNPAYPVMYQRGYERSFNPGAAHQGCSRCRKGDGK
jgi:hypothetical protein